MAARESPVSDRVLVLFDIDGTLVDCGSTAGKCFAAAFRRVFGVRCPRFKPTDVAGLTDSAILALVLQQANLAMESSARRDELFNLYSRELAAKFAGAPPRALPGVREALRRLASLRGCVPGLLTGSTRATARLKLEYAGIDFAQFATGAFAEDAEARALLPAVAKRRFTASFGAPPRATILVGDTPRDIEAARASGSAFIGVATGHYPAAELFAAGAGIVLPDLTDADRFCREVARLGGGEG